MGGMRKTGWAVVKNGEKRKDKREEKERRKESKRIGRKRNLEKFPNLKNYGKKK
jgi:hypothetical protein